MLKTPLFTKFQLSRRLGGICVLEEVLEMGSMAVICTPQVTELMHVYHLFIRISPHCGGRCRSD